MDPGSAAEAAGMRVGDLLFSVDGAPVAGLDMDQLRAKMQEPAVERTFEFGSPNSSPKKVVKIKAIVY